MMNVAKEPKGARVTRWRADALRRIEEKYLDEDEGDEE